MRIYEILVLAVRLTFMGGANLFGGGASLFYPAGSNANAGYKIEAYH
ncbi:MAG: hypothetical protein ACOH2A_03795 [Sphingobacteriaceae bacterium]